MYQLQSLMKKDVEMYKQIIIARKDLKMSPGKLAAQVSHASMAFLTNQIKVKTKRVLNRGYSYHTAVTKEPGYHYECILEFDEGLYEQWILGSFTKVTLGARNKNQLLKAVEMAKELGMEEGVDFFLIKDNCYTELEPEEIDEEGVGRTLTCIGFRPMDSEVIDKIGRKYHIYT